jgi:hypothetical protein
LKPLSDAELKTLISEAKYKMSSLDKAKSKEARMVAAVKKRNALKIGEIATFSARDGNISGAVIGISVDKIQIDLDDGKKKSFSILKLV